MTNVGTDDGNSPDKEKFWFFLGGHDLEMLTIRELLDTYYNSRYSDKSLKWGAKVSDYKLEIQKKIDEGFTAVLIELEPDIELAVQPVIHVDHHGDKAGADAATSLEQVFFLLGLPEDAWSRHLSLVAANDRGHIRELQQRGASNDEILKIRQDDWKAQGIDDEEVDQAKAALRDAQVPAKGYLRVFSKNDRSSVIADLASRALEGPGFTVLFVTGPAEANLYGPGYIIESLNEAFKDSQSTWCGGALPEYGFWGMGLPDKADRDPTLQRVHKVIISSLLQDSKVDLVDLKGGSPHAKPASYTQFILPIAYQPTRCEKDISKASHQFVKMDLSDARKHADEILRERRRYFTEETGAALYKYAAWFTLLASEQSNMQERTHTEEAVSFGTFEFHACSTNRSLSIQISAPRLVLFNWDLAKAYIHYSENSENTSADQLLNGFLIIELCFKDAIRFSELLEVNETFRTLQLPFDGYHQEHIAPRYLESNHNEQSILELLGSTRAGIQEDMSNDELLSWGKWLKMLSFPLAESPGQDGARFMIADEQWLHRACLAMRHREWIADPHVFKNSDTKAFVWTAALPRDPKAFKEISKLEDGRRWLDGDWIKLLNVDKPSGAVDSHRQMLGASAFEREWANQAEHTYRRWASFGTYYGFTDHSGALCCPALTEPPLWQHFRLLYRDQAIFLLYIRATLFRFSRSISEITQHRLCWDEESREGAREMEKFKRGFERLRRRFVEFANLYQFPLLSTEQQGLEMYNAQRVALDVDPLYREVQSQIDNAHAYASLGAQREATELTTIITVLGIPLLLSGLIASVVGMDMTVPYMALLDLVGKTDNAELVDAVTNSGGFVRVALWLLALLIVLLPIRLFENRLFDFSSSVHRRIQRKLRFVRRFVAISFAILLTYMLIKTVCQGLPAIALAGFVIIGFFMLLSWPLYLCRRFARGVHAFRKRETGGLREAWKAFWSRPIVAPLSNEFFDIIQKRIESQREQSNARENKQRK